MSKGIPGHVRAAVRGRERQHCVRCGMKGAEIHHRRSRSVHDEHRDCTCNTVYLCGWGNLTGCHGWAHSHPFEARGSGLVVPRHVAEPGLVPVEYMFSGPMLLTCDGHLTEVAMASFPAIGEPPSPVVDLYPIEPLRGSQSD